MAPEGSDDWRWKARRALSRFGPRAIPALVEALSVGDDPTIRRFAADSLALLGVDARSASEALRHARIDRILEHPHRREAFPVQSDGTSDEIPVVRRKQLRERFAKRRPHEPSQIASWCFTAELCQRVLDAARDPDYRVRERAVQIKEKLHLQSCRRETR